MIAATHAVPTIALHVQSHVSMPAFAAPPCTENCATVANSARSTQQGNDVPMRSEQPSRGAEQPTPKNPAVDTTAGTGKEATALTSLEHCATWLSTLTTYRSDEPVRRLVKALSVLQAEPSRTRRSDIHSMLKSRDVPQKNETKIAAANIAAMLEMKVLEEARRLKTLHDSRGSSSAIQLAIATPPQTDDRRVRR